MIYQELQASFIVEFLEQDFDRVPNEIKVLALVHPKELTPQTLYAIDQFVLRGGKLHEITFRHGEAVAPLEVIGDAEVRTGSEITFKPSQETFTSVEFSYATLEHRLRELAFLNKGLIIKLTDKRAGREKENLFEFKGGIVSFVETLTENGQGGERETHLFVSMEETLSKLDLIPLPSDIKSSCAK